MRNLILLLIAAIAGGIIPFQGSINAQLGQLMKHPLQASLISFTGGVLTLLIVLLILRPELPSRHLLTSIPWYMYLGGVIGAVFVTTVLLLVPQIGITNMLAAAIVGQLVISAVIDHFGILDVPVHPVSLARVGGILLLIGGLILIQK